LPGRPLRTRCTGEFGNEALPDIYDKLVAGSSRYVMVCEVPQHNPSPVEVTRRGHEHPLDDSAWFLMEKQS
jgi:hypothetical protein